MNEDQFYSTVRARLLEIRRQRLLTQSQLAEAAGICESSYRGLESGAVRTSLYRAWLLSAALGVDLCRLPPPPSETRANGEALSWLPRSHHWAVFRFQEMVRLTDSASGCLVFGNGKVQSALRFLAWVNSAKSERDRLARSIIGVGELGEGWRILDRKSASLSVYLCLKEPFLNSALEYLAGVYLDHWLSWRKIAGLSARSRR